MTGFTIGWEYLTGYAVATDPGDRQRVEWPPHPARVFMAMAAAWFETGRDSDEGDALRWLESLDDGPELRLPLRGAEFERSRVTVYVPVNDKAGPSAATLQSAPAMTRSKQPRSFPRIWVGSEPCHLRWPNASGEKRLRDALDRLCGKVTRIGHSSSLVRMWVDDSDDSPGEAAERWLPDNGLADVQVRQTSRGMLDMLADRYGAAPRRRHAELTDRIASLKAEQQAIKGKGAKNRKAAMDQAIDNLKQELVITIPRPPVRPSIGLWSGYRRTGDDCVEPDARPTHFDTDLLVLKHVAGPRLPVVSTLAVTQALRSTLMNGRDVPAWVSGHEPDGTPLRNEDGHLAVIPLPFVGHEHADGHLLGVGLAFPENVDRRERGRVLGSLLLEKNGEAKPIDLTLGRLGVWTVEKRHWSDEAHTLQPETWTAHPAGAKIWASVTPVVLDRFPKQDRVKNRFAWSEEVAEILRQACERIGLPEPIGVDIDTTSWHLGSPRSVGKRRRLRSRESAESNRDASLGNGFPLYPSKGRNASRPQVHVWLQFAQPVVGPILLGAGRYRGYGLFKPWKGAQA